MTITLEQLDWELNKEAWQKAAKDIDNQVVDIVVYGMSVSSNGIRIEPSVIYVDRDNTRLKNSINRALNSSK